jgi:hypothetical protein
MIGTVPARYRVLKEKKQNKQNSYWYNPLHQIFIRHVRTLLREDIKVLIGDNLAAHLSPYVLRMCSEYNIWLIFLPENSTHLLQPLDVAVFAPIKRWWRTLLYSWKEECFQKGTVYATIPKDIFPSLLKKLLEKDYSNSIISGFESCGLFPFSLEKALKKLPKEDWEVESHIQQQLLNQLSSMRYNQPTQKQASRPKKRIGSLPGPSTHASLTSKTSCACLGTPRRR